MWREKGRPGHPERRPGCPPPQGGTAEVQGGPGDPRAFAGAAATPVFGRPANWAAQTRNGAAAHPQSHPPPHTTPRPTPGRGKPHNSHKGRGSLRQSAAIAAVWRSLPRSGRIPFKFRAQAAPPAEHGTTAPVPAGRRPFWTLPPGRAASYEGARPPYAAR